jgi:6-phosphogluconate dehydrogenase
MQVGIIGLGRMGGGMARRLLAAGHTVVGYNRTVERAEEMASSGLVVASTLTELVEKLPAPRVIYVMLPAGETTEEMLVGAEGISTLLSAGDVVIDGGNSRFSDGVRRAEILSREGIEYVDQGTSGGLAGEERGYCLMVGAKPEVFSQIEPLLKDLAMPEGYIHTGPVGSGHFAKMVHNAIEYGMMQSMAEGVELLQKSDFTYDYAKLLNTWQHGSIIESFLIDILQQQLAANPQLDGVSSEVSDNGEGRWAVEEAINRAVPFYAISSWIFARFASRQKDSFSGKVLSAMRLGFGGHKV